MLFKAGYTIGYKKLPVKITVLEIGRWKVRRTKLIKMNSNEYEKLWKRNDTKIKVLTSKLIESIVNIITQLPLLDQRYDMGPKYGLIHCRW